jgi:hypothetical protein
VFAVGDAVVVFGFGAGRVTGVDAEKITVGGPDGEVSVRVDETEALVRSAIDRGRATAFLGRLCERCKEERTFPELRSLRHVERAPIDEQVEYLRWYFRKKKALKFREENMLLAASDRVLGEIALALDVDASLVRLAVRSGKPTLERPASRPLPSAPSIAGANHVRSFWLSKAAYVAEWPETKGDRKKISVTPGAWHAFAFESAVEGEEDDDAEGLFAVHADHPRATLDEALAVAQTKVGSPNVEGGSIGILDAAALTDPAFGEDEVQRSRNEGEAYGDRGVDYGTGGDGAVRILLDDRAAATVVVLMF